MVKFVEMMLRRITFIRSAKPHGVISLYSAQKPIGKVFPYPKSVVYCELAFGWDFSSNQGEVDAWFEEQALRWACREGRAENKERGRL